MTTTFFQFKYNKYFFEIKHNANSTLDEDDDFILNKKLRRIE